MTSTSPGLLPVMALIVALSLAAMAAAGAVLMIKITRRRQAARGIGAGLETGVPAVPLSAEQAATWRRRYWRTSATVLVTLAIVSAVLLWLAS